MKLFLVRHAETNYNLQKLANADPRIDVHLTENGINQAKNLATSLNDATFEVVFISELPRTRQTAEIINKSHNRKIIVDGRLNDNKTGFESKPAADWMAVLVVTHGFMTQVIFGYIEHKNLDEAAQFNLLQGTYAEFDI